MKNIIVGTAGHIDHGKTALVKALTGIDADRLKEEKQRGITIDIGFADLTIGDLRFGFVDVPGHERFIKNMLAGVHGIDLVMLVVAADESIMPQTREHFDICRLLKVKSGLTVITKADLVDAELLELVKAEVADFIAGSFLEGGPVVAVSSRTGEGIEELKAKLGELASTLAVKGSDTVPRLPVDRAFTIKGFGTIVTGTLISGKLSIGDEVELLPARVRSRIRGLQVHGAEVEVAVAGQRTAVNLQGVDLSQIKRGDVLVPARRFHTSSMIDVRLELLKSARPLESRARVRFHHGTSEIMARVILLDQDKLMPGDSALAQLRLEAPTLVMPRDRFIIRSYSPQITIGGGLVIDSLPAKHRTYGEEALEHLQQLESADDIEFAAQLVVMAGERGVSEPELVARTGLTDDALSVVIDLLVREERVVKIGNSPFHLISRAAYEKLKNQVIDLLTGFHNQEPLKLGISREEVRERVFAYLPAEVFRAVVALLCNKDVIVAEKDLLRLASHRVTLSEGEERIKKQLADSFESAGLQPITFEEVVSSLGVDEKKARRLFQLLIASNELIPIGELTFHRKNIEELKNVVRKRKEISPVLDVGTFKDLTGISRKYAIPLLEYLDRERITRRVGNEREIL